MEDQITNVKVDKYMTLTESALNKVSKNIHGGMEDQAREIISMASNYISDSKHFLNKGDRVNCFAALNYAHGWIDCGVRLGIFDVTDNKLFTIR
jgi:uncharacterized protein